MSMYLGIDLGTSAVKVVLAEDDRLLADASRPLTVQRPQMGFCEQAPEDWFAATDSALQELQQQQPRYMAAVRAIGLSGQMHGATLLDAQGAVLRPCLLWNDTRASAEAAELDALPIVRQRTGNLVFPGFTAPKCLWVARHEPDVFAKVAQVLLPKDYLRWRLTGAYATDLSDASGTSWLDVGQRCWSKDLLTISGMSAAHLPELHEGSAPTGVVHRQLCQRWGLPNEVIVAAGGGDNAASAIGLGVVRDGEAFISLGSSGVIFIATERFLPCPESAVHSFCHALPGTWHQMSVMLSAMDCLHWLSGNLQRPVRELVAAWEADCVTGASPSAGLLFFPYLAGERTPYNDAHLRAAFIGLDAGHQPHHLTGALLQGIAFALRDNLQVLTASGRKPAHLLVIGGGGQSGVFLQLLADVLDIPLVTAEGVAVGAAFGAARLARLASTDDAPLTVCQTPAERETYFPKPTAVAAFAEIYQRWHSLIPVLRGAHP